MRADKGNGQREQGEGRAERNNGRSGCGKQTADYMFASGDVSKGVTVGRGMKKGSFAGNWAVAVINLRKGVATADRRWSRQLGAASAGRWQEQQRLRCAATGPAPRTMMMATT